MKFKLAETVDKENIKALYESVKGTKYCTWNSEYPGDFEIENDISAGTLYVLCDKDKLIGAISIIPENEQDNLKIWKNKENAMEFARVCVALSNQGKGYGRLLVTNIENEIKKRGGSSVHILVAKKNAPAFKLYMSLGYEIRGEVSEYGNDFYACEKVLPV